jgi:hypothetical protein
VYTKYVKVCKLALYVTGGGPHIENLCILFFGRELRKANYTKSVKKYYLGDFEYIDT